MQLSDDITSYLDTFTCDNFNFIDYFNNVILQILLTDSTYDNLISDKKEKRRPGNIYIFMHTNNNDLEFKIIFGTDNRYFNSKIIPKTIIFTLTQKNSETENYKIDLNFNIIPTFRLSRAIYTHKKFKYLNDVINITEKLNGSVNDLLFKYIRSLIIYLNDDVCSLIFEYIKNWCVFYDSPSYDSSYNNSIRDPYYLIHKKYNKK